MNVVVCAVPGKNKRATKYSFTPLKHTENLAYPTTTTTDCVTTETREVKKKTEQHYSHWTVYYNLIWIKASRKIFIRNDRFDMQALTKHVCRLCLWGFTIVFISKILSNSRHVACVRGKNARNGSQRNQAQPTTKWREKERGRERA